MFTLHNILCACVCLCLREIKKEKEREIHTVNLKQEVMLSTAVRWYTWQVAVMFYCAYGREKFRPLSACEDAVTNEVFVHSHHKHSESQPPATAVIMHERVVLVGCSWATVAIVRWLLEVGQTENQQCVMGGKGRSLLYSNSSPLSWYHNFYWT